MTFTLTHDQELDLAAWRASHKCRATRRGGSETFQFTPTGIGLAVSVLCACGAKFDLSDYDNW